MRRVAILGATGSVGSQAIDVIGRHPDRFRIVALAARSDAEGLFRLVRKHRPLMAALTVEPRELPEDVRFCDWRFGEDGAERVAEMPEADDALSAVVGIAGLPAALAALRASKRLLLANKESLVAGGALVMGAARSFGGSIVPVDSEHSAIHQALRGADGNPPARLILTASGGPFRGMGAEGIRGMRAADALRHPTWRMGRKITVDSASMMNKGFEVIEAHHLFSMPLDRIDVLVHPESVAHSLVEFADGAVIAQLGAPDMRLPIAYALGCPERLESGAARLDLAGRSLTFEPVDARAFPCLGYAYEAQAAGGAYPIALNAANELAVEAFLKGDIRFGGIADAIRETLDATVPRAVPDLGAVQDADREARRIARRILDRLRMAE